MTTAIFDRLAISGAAIFDRLVPTVGIPTITALSTVRDGATFTITGTSFSASGNSVVLTQGDKTLLVPIGTEGTTSIVTAALDTSGLYLTQPVTITVFNVSSVSSNSVNVTVLSKSQELSGAISQEFLGDIGTRLGASPDAQITDEWRIKNVVGVGGVDITDIVLTGQGAFVVTSLANGSKKVTAFDAAIQDGSLLSPYTTQSIIDPPTTASVPNIRNEALAQAESDVLSAGFTYVVNPGVQDATVLVGRVSGQFPAAGVSWPLGAVVEITPSLGATGVIAPTLTVLSKADAEALRSTLGLIGASNPYVDGNNNGQVVNQSVAPGTLLQVGDTLDLVYSSNLMLPLIGQQVGRAQAAVTSANLTNSDTVIRLPSSLYALDVVMDQSPSTNSLVNPGDVVTLTVSSGSSASAIAGAPAPFRSYGHKGRKGMKITTRPKKK